MNLKAAVAADQSPDLFRGRAASIAIAASPAVASARMARAIEGGIIDADPAEKMASAIVAGITAAVRRQPPIDPAVLHSRHQRKANQRCRADRNSEGHKGARHRLLLHAGRRVARRKNAHFRQDW